MSLSRNTAYNVAGQTLPLALSLLCLPLYLRLIGEERFGALALLWLFFGFFSLFDLGMGQAIAQRLAARTDHSAAAEVELLSTGLLVALVFGAIGAAIAWPIGVWSFQQMDVVSASLRLELLRALPLAVALIPIATVSAVLTGGLQARSAFAQINVATILSNALATVVPLAVAQYLSTELVALIAAVVAARTLGLFALYYCCRSRYFRGNCFSVCLPAVRQLLKFGGWATVSAAVGPLLLILDRGMIGALLGVAAVSYYAIPFQVAERTVIFSAALNSAMFPKLAAATDEFERRALCVRGVSLVAIAISPAAALGVAISHPLLSMWISQDLANSAFRVAQILCFGFWINSLALVPYTVLLARGRADLIAKSHTIQIPVYWLMLWAGLEFWGLAGAAIAFVCRVLVDLVLLAWLAGVLATIAKFLALPMCVLVFTLVVAGTQPGASLTSAITGIGSALVLTIWSVRRFASLRRADSAVTDLRTRS